MVIFNVALFVMSVISQHYAENRSKPLLPINNPTESMSGEDDFKVRYSFEMEPLELRGFEDTYNNFDKQGKRKGQWIFQKDQEIILCSYSHGKKCGQLIEMEDYDGNGKYSISSINVYANDSLVLSQMMSNYAIMGIDVDIKENTDFIWPDNYNSPITESGYQSYNYLFDKYCALIYEGNCITLDYDDLDGPCEYVGIGKYYWKDGIPVTIKELGFRKEKDFE